MILSITIIPNASRDEIVGWVGDTLKIRIAAPPVEGRANEALIKFLAKHFDLAPSEIEIVVGHASKHKRISLPIAKEDIVF